MRAIDTNVLIRLIVDEEQSAAAEHFARDGVWVSTLVLAEAAWVLTKLYDWRPVAVADAMEVLLDSESVVLQDSRAVARALGLFRARPSLRFTDCLNYRACEAGRASSARHIRPAAGEVGGCPEDLGQPQNDLGRE